MTAYPWGLPSELDPREAPSSESTSIGRNQRGCVAILLWKDSSPLAIAEFNCRGAFHVAGMIFLVACRASVTRLYLWLKGYRVVRG